VLEQEPPPPGAARFCANHREHPTPRGEKHPGPPSTPPSGVHRAQKTPIGAQREPSPMEDKHAGENIPPITRKGRIYPTRGKNAK